MGLTLEEQGQGFLIALAVGFVLGAFYDVFRIYRVFARSEKRQVIWQDIFVCFVAAVASFLLALAVNWGEIRFYLLAGEAIGMCVYFLTLGEITFRLAKLLLRILKAIKNFLMRWFFQPVGRLFCWVFRRIKNFCIKIGKVIAKPLNFGRFRKKRKKPLETSPPNSV